MADKFQLTVTVKFGPISSGTSAGFVQIFYSFRSYSGYTDKRYSSLKIKAVKCLYSVGAVSTKCRLQTGYKMTMYKNADCRLDISLQNADHRRMKTPDRLCKYI